MDIRTTTALSWTASKFAATHDVYLGKTLADVEATSSDAILDILGREIAGTRLNYYTDPVEDAWIMERTL